METALIDGDLVVHRTCAAVEREVKADEGWVYRWSDPDEVMEQVMALRTPGADHDAPRYYYFSGPDNFRKGVDPGYKAQRSGGKPLAFAEVRDRLRPRFESQTLEADDLLGLHADQGVIVTTDKDLLMVPGKHYNPYDPNAKIRTVDQAEGTYNFLTQVLTGDPTDNYPGCPGVGKVTAKKLLDKKCDWGTVVDAYAKKDLTEEDAIHQARLAYILHKEGDYDWETGEVRLWTPEVYFG